MSTTQSLYVQLDRLRQRSLLVGLAGLTLFIVGAFLNPQQFFRSYLVAYLFWIGISLGCFGIVMLHHLVGGGWGFAVRRLLESGAGTLPLMALLFVPLLLGLRELYLWAQPAEVSRDALLQYKSAYLNAPFFLFRTFLYFAAWIGVAYFLNKWSVEQDRAADPSLVRRLQLLSGAGLVLYVITATFSSIDWVMSLEPHWHSTIYGMLFIAGHALEGMAFVIVVGRLLAGEKPLSDVISSGHFHDLGNLLMSFLLFWAYIAFSQFLIVWSENLREEIPWYFIRTQGGWQGIGLSLIMLQFALPFTLLLSRMTKRRSQVLALVALVILFMRLVDLFWVVAPAFHPTGLKIHWLDLVSPVGIGGIWIWVFLWRLKKRALVPLHDPGFPSMAGGGRGE